VTILTNILTALRERYPATGNRLPIARVAFDRASQIAIDFEAQSQKIRGDKKLTDEGQNEVLRRFVASDAIAPHVQYVTRSATGLHNAIEARRKRLVPKTPDPADAAGASFRAEVRTMLRTETDRLRKAKLLNPETADLSILEAVLTAPSVMSGIDDAKRAELADAYAKRAFPDDVKAIAEAERVAEALDIVTKTLITTLQSVDDFRPNGFSPTKVDLNAFVAESLGPQRVANIDQQVVGEWKDFATSGSAGA
jgi:hypothetical protein